MADLRMFPQETRPNRLTPYDFSKAYQGVAFIDTLNFSFMKNLTKSPNAMRKC
jgi:hypothetical protein